MTTSDIIAVGSGHNGLVAAAYLAVAGKKVLVLERNAWFGGGVDQFVHPLVAARIRVRARELNPKLRPL